MLTQTQEDFDFCDPVMWWYKQRTQFPNLYCMAHDIMSIPGMFFFVYASAQSHIIIVGSAVAVERIFSSSRDTISMRCANLKPGTIRTLMLVKHWLRLARTAVEELLGDDEN